MKYARPYIKKYWVFEHKKALGLSFLMFSATYSVGLAFFLILNAFFIPSIYTTFVVVFLLFVLLAFVIIGSIINAHNKVSKLMNANERRAHSKHVGIFLILFIIGLVLCVIPLVFFIYPGMIMFLLTIGGVLLLLYIILMFVFDYKFYELAFASIFIWSVYVVSAFLIAPIYFSNHPLFNVISLFITSITIITVFAISGIMLLQSSFDEIIKDTNYLRRG